MGKKIVVIRESSEVWTYILENDDIVEIHYDKTFSSEKLSHHVGNIYIGRVKKILKQIGAAFIEIEPGLECYYHTEQAQKAFFTTKIGKKPLAVGDELLVQLSKEGIKSKAPTVSSNLSFPGHYTVLTTGNTRMGVSSKIPEIQRDLFKELLKEYENEDYGLIIRTKSRGVSFELIRKEIEEHILTYRELIDKSITRTCFSALQVVPPNYITNIRNVFIEGSTEIIVNDQEVYYEICDFLSSHGTKKVPHVRLYNDSRISLQSLFNTKKTLEHALNERVWLKCGGYIVIQATEALTAIDVNSSKYIKIGSEREAALNVNIEAAIEIAKQLRLRNLSGIIIVDFINMEEEGDFQILGKELKIQLSKDSIQTTFVGFTNLNLVEITRKKIRKPLSETLTLSKNKV